MAYKNCAIFNTDTKTVFYGQLDLELVGKEGYPFREATQDEINPPLTPEQIKQNNNALILAQLQKIDDKSIRALRAGETAIIAELENQAIILRSQLQK